MDFYSSLDSRFLDSETPTLFELISSQQLDQLLTPSIRYILVYYTQRYPQYLIKILNKFDELNLVFRGLVEYNSLKNWNGSFIEKFYGLKRCNDKKYLRNLLIPLNIRESKKRLTNLQLLISLFEVIGIPYLKEKLDVYYDKIYSKYLLNNVTSLQRFFIKAYPVLKFLGQLANFITLISMLSGKNKSPSILCWVFGIRYSRLNLYDYDLNDALNLKEISSHPSSKKLNRVRPPTPQEHISLVLKNSYKLLKKLIYLISNKIFPVSIFLLKFLEWWNSSEFVSKLKQKQDIEIDPPVHTRTRYIYKKDGECPICDKTMVTPLLLDTGYVFCYQCIHNYLTNQDKTKSPRCPVTGELLLNCKLDNENNWQIECLRRLMV